jgi:hypothetical protein
MIGDAITLLQIAEAVIDVPMRRYTRLKPGANGPDVDDLV